MAFVFTGNSLAATTITHRQGLPLNSGWEFRQLVSGPTVESANAAIKDASQWHPAVVPGCVHLDLLRNKLIPDPVLSRQRSQAAMDRERRLGISHHRSRPPRHCSRRRTSTSSSKASMPTPRSISTTSSILTADNMFREWRVNVKPDLKAGANSLRIVFPSPIKIAAEIAANDPWQPKDPRRAQDLRPQSRLRIRMGLGTALRHQRHLASGAPRGLG